ncbi:MAG: class I SAM-dependent methyltransferase [Alphaproteobacteria bacterium]|nr:class I SAM-dependent methyltransferase [Alphaproteobacteria bacterium]
MLRQIAERARKRFSTGRATSRNRARNAALGPAYALSQTARTAWYAGQYIAAQRLTPPIPTVRARGPAKQDEAMVGWGPILADLTALYRQDWRNIRDGLYRPPADMTGSPLKQMREAARFFSHLPGVVQRRRRNGHSDVNQTEAKGAYPRYYLQNFHFQNDGWLSDESAAVYDHQVEVLFTGGADAMRRQGLPALKRFLDARESGSGPARVVDIACGSGRFLSEIIRNHPTVEAIGLDLSRPYLDKAARDLPKDAAVTFLEGAAEDVPLADASVDAATCIYLYHELPPKVRAEAAAEAFRVLKPGGLFLVIDTIVKGDRPAYDGLLDKFPVAFHEPYYQSFVDSDPAALFETAGFAVDLVERAFFSRVMAMRKPG